MKTRVRKLLLFGLLLAICLATGIWFRGPSSPRIAHQRPYKWDQYLIPEIRFTNEPISNVVSSINHSVWVLSKRLVERVILLDTTPIQISKFTARPDIERQMDEMILAFRRHEDEIIRRGARGYESGHYSGRMGGGHSLGCTFQELAEELGLSYEEREDGIHMRRDPHELECRAYSISKGLAAVMEQKRRANDLHVDAEPIVSAFAQATQIHSWTVDVPDGPNSYVGEFRFDKVFRHLPDAELILALAVPAEHAEAVKRLKAEGLWEDVAAK
jgi:hypothetical protein